MFLFNMSNKSTSLFLSLKKKVSRYLEKKKKKTVQESTMKNYPEIKKKLVTGQDWKIFTETKLATLLNRHEKDDT